MDTRDPRARPLRHLDLDPDPLRQFAVWFDEAASEPAFREAAALATATPAGRPSVRMVLLKGYGPDGFAFFTGRESRKGCELAANPYAALCFYFHDAGRQVRIEGAVTEVGGEESDAYFASRPRGSQLSAAASPQSRRVTGRHALEQAVIALETGLAGAPVPRPAHWGGYRIVPDALEFWQHRDDRLHDRFLYTRTGGAWTLERLGP